MSAAASASESVASFKDYESAAVLVGRKFFLEKELVANTVPLTYNSTNER